MPPRRRTRRAKDPSPTPTPEPSPSPEVEEQENEENDGEVQDGALGGDGAAEAEGLEGELSRLKFDEPLTWRPGKPIPVSQLLPRLQRLFEELSDIDQDRADKDSLMEVAHALAQRNLIQHKEPPIKAYVAACIVEILRVCAPDAPFTEDQLKAIFTFIITYILPALKDPSHPYNGQHKHVLTSLAEVKSILLLNDLDGADNLLLHLFSTCFDCVSASTILDSDGNPPTDVEAHMTNILVFLIDESPGLPAKVVEAVIAQFLRPAHFKTSQSRSEKSEANGGQSTLLPKKEPPAYVMAKMICTENPERMARYVSQYFSDVIMDASSFATKSNGNKHGDDDEGETSAAGPTEADLKNLSQAHLLIRELWRAAPAVLQNVIPQVEAELSADDVHLRQIATETFGDMISGIGAAGPPPPPNYDSCQYPPLRLADESSTAVYDSVLTTPMCSQSFAETYHAAHNSFLGRRKDKVPQIRAAWTTAAGYVLATSAGGIGLKREEQSQLVNALGEKLNDSDEKVRLAAVKAIELFSFRDVVTKLGSKGGVQKDGSVLASLADRCRDKRPAVRVEAMVVLAKLWAVAAGEIAAGQESVVACLSGIPTRILNVFYANDSDLNVLLDRVLYECLVPLGFPPKKPKGGKGAAGSSQSQTASGAFDPDRIRAERMLQLVKSLEPSAKKAFLAIQGRQPQFAKIVSLFIQGCEAFNGGTIDDNEKATTANLNTAINYIGGFFPDPPKVKADLQRFAKLNDRRNYQLVKFAIGSESDFKTVHGAIKELIKRVQGGNAPHLLDTLLPILYRSSCLMLNRSHLPAIMDCSKSDKDGLGAVAHEVLGEISHGNPDIFKTHVGDLCKSLVEQAPSERRENDASAVDVLKACASYSRKYPKEIPQEKSFSQTLMNYAMYGKPAKAAKYAVDILLARKDDKAMVNATSLLQRVMKDKRYEAPRLLNRLSIISQLELLAPKVALDYDKDILDLAVQKILLNVRTDAKDSDPVWVNDEDMDEEIQAKCLCLKILVNRLRSIEDPEEAKKESAAVFKLLRSLIAKDGEICKVKDTPKYHRTRLLLHAAQLTLKLCTIKHLDEMLQPKDFNTLAFVAQRGEPAVRHGFIEKVQKYLVQGKLRLRFNTIIFLTAFEPSVTVKQRLETWIRSRAQYYRGKNQQALEAVMGRLLSLLAHHPDYSTDVDNLVDHARYLVYYVSNVATEDNLGLIMRYAERAKQTRDGIDPAKSENVYVLCDLAQAVLRKWQEKKNWTFRAWAEGVGLPTGLYSALPSHAAAQEIAEKQYLPDGVDEKLDLLIRSVDRKKKRKSVDERAEPSSKRTKTLVSREKKTTEKSKKKAPARAAKPKKAAKPKWASPDVPAADRRRSSRGTKASTKYTERDSSEDDEEMLDGVAEWEYLDKEEDDKDEGREGGGSGSESALSDAPDSEDEESD
ncbi:related to SPO76 protein [Cephalotrichum gorgonifer]|uniref:Related to SPO76 protein n=1 Tax=Cephalotrichum gorgonifer TaxID=2041049 RepID=A0AAE8N115_9PEZI|nr:related to SPO76 protein [Cephalotrichum gorgonifer]